MNNMLFLDVMLLVDALLRVLKRGPIKLFAVYHSRSILGLNSGGDKLSSKQMYNKTLKITFSLAALSIIGTLLTIIFLILAFQVDPYKAPTIFMVLAYITNTIKHKKNTKENFYPKLDVEKKSDCIMYWLFMLDEFNRVEKTVDFKILNTISLIYYFYVLFI
ncbi:MAG: hypothetical protein ACOCQR_03135 [bacterium]